MWKLKDLQYLDKPSLSVLVLAILRTLFHLLDLILDTTIGYTITQGWREDRAKSLNYDHSAQLVTVLYRGAYSLVFHHQPSNFLYCHAKYVHPRYILDNDNVILLGVSPTHAFFSVTHDPDRDVMDPDKPPFMYLNGFTMAEQLVLIPLSTMHRLASEIGDPDDVTILDMTGRCGSTLMCQVLSKVPGVRTLSEPWATVHAHVHHLDGKFDLNELKQVVRSIMRLQCKPEHKSTKSDKILVKFACPSLSLQPVIQELFPKFKFVFITRHFADTMRSFLKITINLPTFYGRTHLYRDFMLAQLPFPYEDQELWMRRREEFRSRIDPDMWLQTFFVMYAAEMSCFLKNKKSYHHVMIYEDFVEDPITETKRLFDVMGIGHEHVEEALTALRSDSQQAVFGQRGNEGVEIKRETWREFDEIMEECGVPISSKMTLEELRELLY